MKSGIFKESEEDFNKRLMDNLKDDKTNKILIRGFSWKLNLINVLSALKEANLTSGLLTTGILGNIPPLFREIGYEGVSATLEGKTIIDGINFSFSKFDCRIKEGWGEDFNLFFPVQSMLLNEKGTNKVIEAISNSRAKKTIILITNDFTRNPEKLYLYVDSCQILDIHNSENIDPLHGTKLSKVYNTVIENLKAKNKEIPY